MARVTKATISGLIDDLRATHGDNLASVVLYGSSSQEGLVDLSANGSLLIALHRITPQDLRLAQAPMREWERLGHTLPVYFTVEELHDAADVFPIEFHHMEQARTVLYGEDVLGPVEISDANLRHQAEYELRSKLIQLRRLYIPASKSSEQLSELMKDSLASFAALFRAVLILHGEDPPIELTESVRATVRRLKLDSATFDRIVALGESPADSLTEEESNDLFGAYMDQIQKVIEIVDTLGN